MIRRAEKEHLDEVMEIWLETNISAHPFVPEICWYSAFEQVREAMPSSDLFIYSENGRMMAFIGITDNEYIAGLFVSEDVQSCGIGQKLLDYCKERYTHLELDVFAENSRAVRFYQNNGFEIADVRINPEFFNHEEYRMAWSA